ncbi:hypothetical protein PIB30_099539, partial [Stylosanthes scabra]|nr:hypothetical protein [Stylosanthes scabra]
ACETTASVAVMSFPRLGIELWRLGVGSADELFCLSGCSTLGVGCLAPGRGLAECWFLALMRTEVVSTLGVGAGRLGVDELLCLLSLRSSSMLGVGCLAPGRG